MSEQEPQVMFERGHERLSRKGVVIYPELFLNGHWERMPATRYPGRRWLIRAVEALLRQLEDHTPTQDAYDAACAALEKHRKRADDAEAQNEQSVRDGLEQAAGVCREQVKHYKKKLAGLVPGPYSQSCLHLAIELETEIRGLMFPPAQPGKEEPKP